MIRQFDVPGHLCQGTLPDMVHVQHAYKLLNPGGRVVAIMGEGVFFGRDKRAQEFRDWLEGIGGTDEKLPEGTFQDPSLPVNTGVNARMVVIEKGPDVSVINFSSSSFWYFPLADILFSVVPLVSKSLSNNNG
jgi:hypothetical protein